MKLFIGVRIPVPEPARTMVTWWKGRHRALKKPRGKTHVGSSPTVTTRQMNKCSVYLIRNLLDNKIYIGQTWLDIKERFAQHAKPNSGCVKLRNAILKYGRDSFSIEILAQTSSQILGDYLESIFIVEYDSINMGYNLRYGGQLSGRPSEETKRKISESSKGKIISAETRQKLSSINLGKKLSIQTKEKLSIISKGIPKSKEFIENMSKGRLGKKHSEETKQKMRKPKSEEARRKMSEARKGKPPWNKGLKREK